MKRELFGSQQKNFTVESETKKILHENINYKNVWLKSYMASWLTEKKTFRLKNPTATGLILKRQPERLTLRSSTATMWCQHWLYRYKFLKNVLQQTVSRRISNFKKSNSSKMTDIYMLNQSIFYVRITKWINVCKYFKISEGFIIVYRITFD